MADDVESEVTGSVLGMGIGSVLGTEIESAGDEDRGVTDKGAGDEPPSADFKVRNMTIILSYIL